MSASYSVLLAALLGIGALLAGPSRADSHLFREDFDGNAVDTTVWQVQPGDGLVHVENGTLTLSSPPGEFPSLVTRGDPLEALTEYVIRARIRYPLVGCNGNGFFPQNVYSSPGCHVFRVWQDCHGWWVCAGSGVLKNIGSNETAYHVYEWQVSGGMATLLIDGLAVDSSPVDAVPVGLALGHLHPIFGNVGWTELQVDYIYVDIPTPTRSSSASWGRIKVLYR